MVVVAAVAVASATCVFAPHFLAISSFRGALMVAAAVAIVYLARIVQLLPHPVALVWST